MQIRKTHLAGALAALAGLLTANDAHAQVAVYTLGHADLGVGYDGGLEPHWHIHSGATVNGSVLGGDAEFEPDELLAYVPHPAIARPPGAAWDFLGTAVGGSVWYLPQGNTSGWPFLGIASEELISSDWTSLTLSLKSVSGPAGGHFSLWQTGQFGNPQVKMATSDGITSADSFQLAVGGHDHFNFGFTEPGIYYVGLEWNGNHVTDGPQSASGTFAFGVTVVPEPGETAALAALGLVGFALWRRRAIRGQASV